MYCKLITENDCAVNAVLSCTPVEFLIINKAIARCSNDEYYTESDRRTMVLMGEAMKNFEQVEVADTPQTEICDTCKYRSSNVFGNWCVGRNTCDRYEADTPQTDKDKVVCPNCGRSDYIRNFENDFGIKNSEYRYKCINCNTYIKDTPQTDERGE